MADDSAALAAVVSAVLDARARPAQQRYDDQLDEAVRTGHVDAETARSLRYWQRQSVTEAVEHVRVVLPEVLSVLAAANDDAATAAQAAADSWHRATSGAQPPRAAPVPPPADPTPSPAHGANDHSRRRLLVVAGLTAGGGQTQ